MSTQYVYSMYRLTKRYPPDKEVLSNISISLLPGAKIGVLGYNGAGKSTLLRILAGRDTDFDGEAQLAPGATVGLLEQEPQLDADKDVRGNVEEGLAELRDLLKRFDELAANYSEDTAEEFARIQERIDAADAWSLDQQLDQAMDALRLPPGDADVTTLSGGERRRVALCRLLLEQPDLLLLDEPTNHLDAESVEWLEKHLAAYPGAVLAVTHDRYFLENVAEWILELDRGRAYPYEGNYSTYLETKQARLQVEGAKDAKLKKELERELGWVRSNPKARQAKSKARVQRYEELAAQAERDRKIDTSAIQIPPGPRLGNVVIEADSLGKAFGDKVLMHDVSFSLPRGGIVGIIGPNGVGKTTLFKMVIGQEQPDSGVLRVGETVQISYVDQSREGLQGEENVWQVVSDGLDH